MLPNPRRAWGVLSTGRSIPMAIRMWEGTSGQAARGGPTRRGLAAEADLTD